jgi:hypothetical protein
MNVVRISEGFSSLEVVLLLKVDLLLEVNLLEDGSSFIRFIGSFVLLGTQYMFLCRRVLRYY